MNKFKYGKSVLSTPKVGYIKQRDTQVRGAYTKVFKDFVNRLVEKKDNELVVQFLKACQSGLLGD